MIYNCLIVDDEPVACDIIRNYCQHLPFLQVTKCCVNAIEARQELQEKKTDILFLDINMPVLDGLAFLKTLSNPPAVIFTTAYKEYALNAFDLSACDYLLKPFSLERFIVAIDKAIERLDKKNQPQSSITEQSENFFFIKSDGKITRIEHSAFLFAEAQGNYVKIVLLNTAPILVNMTFANFEELLHSPYFIRVHRSFIVNRSKITQIEGNTMYMDKNEIPIGNSYKEKLLKSLKLQ